MFTLKKGVSAFLFPIPIILLLLGLGLLLLWRGKRRKLGGALVSAAFWFLALASFPPIADGLLGQLEYRWEPFDASAYSDFQPDWILVLGGGFSDEEDALPIHRISIPSYMRLQEGIRLARVYPEATLLLSGAADHTGATGAGIMRDVALQSGFEAERIVLDQESRDTDDQSRTVPGIVGESPFVLVTSASHMTRAMAMFQKQGVWPVPAPVHFQSRRGKPNRFLGYLPSSLSLVNTRTAIYERLGLIWAQIRGHI